MHVGAYYFRAQLYTQVPSQVRDDLSWMRDHGTDAVVLGLLEQDLTAAVENIDRIVATALRLGLAVHITPSRWGNLVAGCPKVPSTFCALHHEAWARQADGAPAMSFLGPQASVHHPATRAFFLEQLSTLLRRWPISGLIWDELKTLGLQDHSLEAHSALGDAVHDPDAQRRAQIAFFGDLNRAAKAIVPALRIGCFVLGSYATKPWLGELAAMPGLDDFGLDGRPWARADGGRDDSGAAAPSKFLIDHGPIFQQAARGAGRQSLFLIENHALTKADDDLMDRRLDQVLALAPDHLLYYYYPRSVEDPDASMAIIGRRLKNMRPQVVSACARG